MNNTMTSSPRRKKRNKDPITMSSDDTGIKRSRHQRTVSDDVVYVASDVGGAIEKQSGVQFVRVDGTMFRIGTEYLLQISTVYAAIDDPPVVWKINGVTDAVVFLATLRHLHPDNDCTRVATLAGWSPRPVLDYIGTPWSYIIETINRLETIGEYQLASTFLHALDRQHRTTTVWNPQTITHWLKTYALLEPDDTGDWIDIKDIAGSGLGNRSLSAHESVLFWFLFVQNENVPYSRAMVGVLRRWPLALMDNVRHHLTRTNIVVIG
jgi:hypothetical protein